MKKRVIILILLLVVLLVFAKPFERDLIKITLKSDRMLDVQACFFGADNSFYSIPNSVSASSDYVVMNIPIPKGEIKHFRFDPNGIPCKANVEIKSILLHQNGKTTNLLENISYISNVANYTKNPDSSLTLNISKKDKDPSIGFDLARNIKYNDKINIYSLLKYIFLFIVFLLVWEIIKSNDLKSRNLILMFASVLALYLIAGQQYIQFPTFQTEDGLWSSLIIKNGFLNTLSALRTDYYVVLNVVLLYIPIQLNTIFYGYDISNLPVFVSLSSFVFYSIFTVHSIYILKKYISSKSCLFFICVSFILLPLTSVVFTYEIIGRICNVGFICFIWLTLIIIELIKKNNFVLQVLALLLCATNPVCYGMYLLYLVVVSIKVFKAKSYMNLLLSLKNKKLLLQTIVLTLGHAVVMLRLMKVYVFKVLGLMQVQPDLVQKTFDLRGIIESGIARSLLYPFVSSIYTSLSSKSTIAIFILYLLIIFIAFRISDLEYKKIIAYFSISTIYITVSSLAMRPMLFDFLKNYTAISPERYYFSQNIMSFILIAFCLYCILKKFKYGDSIFVILSIIILILSVNQFDGARNYYNSRIYDGSFNDQLDKVYIENPYKEKYTVPVYPENWFIDNIDKKYIINS